ncbi:MAG: aspartate carbamoyltransferase catalytic subunit [Coxiellaceae bacterium]|nr:aspartate carbamoyltransferase catalytic subunit [Coxiellaceae bacterium]
MLRSKFKSSKAPHIHHLLTMRSLDKASITYLLDRAEFFLKDVVEKNGVLDTLKGKVAANLFFETSTRTRNSFEIAEHRSGMIVLSPDMKQSSTAKGELLIDTIQNLEAMGVSLLIIRHSDNHLAQFLAMELRTSISVINAGDGHNEHPTQALLDLLTIRQHFADFSKLTVAIVGDVSHSRVARSLIIGLQLMGVSTIRVIAPKNFAPTGDDDFSSAEIFDDMNAGLVDVDVVYMLRIQKERMAITEHPKDEPYFREYGLTEARLALARPTAIVMHPGPMNRGIEIESSVADGPQSVILQQTKNSVAVRMAVIETVLCRP